jgi:hypothetical protein
VGNVSESFLGFEQDNAARKARKLIEVFFITFRFCF